MAWEEGAIASLEAEERERILKQEYKDKLVVDTDVIPDPLTLKSGWLKEDDEGLCKWPSLCLYDIAEYLKKKTTNELVKHLLNEYKEGKAYRYYSCGWVKEISYHSISITSPFCLMKCKVTPSQRISSKPYDVWVVLEKDGDENAGGTVKECYCTCTAGMYGACNHICGMLFRVEAAVKTGITKPTCTDRLAKWNVPSGKTQIQSRPVSELVFKKDHFRAFASVSRDAQEENFKAKQSFSPMTSQQEEYARDRNKVRNDLHNILKETVPKSCFVELMEEKKLIVKVKEPTPKSIFEQAEAFSYNNTKSVAENVTNFKSQISKLTDKERLLIHDNTVGQADNEEWFVQRKGRLTASNFHRICTRTETLQNKEDVDPKNLVSSLLGYTKIPNTPALKHGKSMEIHAKKKYLSLMKKSHKKLKSSDPGLVVMKTKTFIAVSPDLDIKCDCCGQGLVEIKCPYSIRDTSPSAENLPYLEKVDGKTQLKRNSDYYYQIQGQMGVTARPFTDFFVFTCHGHFQERIQFDNAFWLNMVEKLDWFWTNCLALELLTKEIMSNNVSSDNDQHISTEILSSSRVIRDHTQVIKNACTYPLKPRRSNIETTQQRIKASQQKRKSMSKNNPMKKRVNITNICLCGICKIELPDLPSKYEEESIACDKCPLWYHKKCVGIKQRQSTSGEWICKKCVP